MRLIFRAAPDTIEGVNIILAEQIRGNCSLAVMESGIWIQGDNIRGLKEIKMGAGVASKIYGDRKGEVRKSGEL
jgi:hypothetical protein